MAAKVAIVAVPTVLSIASIRVYTVREVPTDGLVPRGELNIYTPVPSSAQAQFVPESPGLLQSGITTTRESILPFFQAVKGACLSVKRGSVNLYHAGEDVFYYLKDPPPEFLPRFGTITMAGLLGMFLARKGSRFKRVAVPIGLMSVGTSVCYPAQAVAVVKVTGKKVYAAGKWSSATVSSLLTPKPQEPATETVASEPQAAKVPNLESAVTEEASAQSSTITETEVESAESVHVSDEPVVPSVSEEVSSLTLAEISTDQTSPDTNTDPVAESVPAETKTTTASEEIPAPAESEEPSDTKQAAENGSIDTSPAESTPSIEPVASVEAATAESAPVEAAPVESTPVAPAPDESAPVAAVEAAAVEAAAVEAAAVEAAPVEAAPVEAAPVEAASVEAAPVEAASVEAAPVEAASVEAASVEAAPVEAAAVEAAPVEAAPVEAASVEAASVEAATVEAAAEAAPMEAAPVEAASIEAAVVEVAPVEVAPVEVAPVEASPEEEVKSVPSSEEPVPIVESAEPAPQPESADPPQVAAVEESPTLTPPLPQEPAAENSKGGSSFKPDPTLMDFGQSNPEDEDLYSTRS
ncbi:MICOS complex subunit MIC27 [Acanthopagrus latus]|uniref:MICOS complex subunit MIC27 n=1 Tax=Acanthopagrus latus TaxID=8177 RepID=UPI00187CBE2B|nr:MICOS complex subunit MIC27 [Acanthopagrus latus]